MVIQLQAQPRLQLSPPLHGVSLHADRLRDAHDKTEQENAPLHPSIPKRIRPGCGRMLSLWVQAPLTPGRTSTRTLFHRCFREHIGWSHCQGTLPRAHGMPASRPLGPIRRPHPRPGAPSAPRAAPKEQPLGRGIRGGGDHAAGMPCGPSKRHIDVLSATVDLLAVRLHVDLLPVDGTEHDAPTTAAVDESGHDWEGCGPGATLEGAPQAAPHRGSKSLTPIGGDSRDAQRSDLSRCSGLSPPLTLLPPPGLAGAALRPPSKRGAVPTVTRWGGGALALVPQEGPRLQPCPATGPK